MVGLVSVAARNCGRWTKAYAIRMRNREATGRDVTQGRPALTIGGNDRTRGRRSAAELVMQRHRVQPAFLGAYAIAVDVPDVDDLEL